VPVFGVARAREFDSYRLEFGEGDKPKDWILIQESKEPQEEDPWVSGRVRFNADWGTTGNLGTWETGLDEYPYGQAWKHNLRGLYTLRLTVKAKDGRTAEHSIQVIVGRVVSNSTGGYGESPDRRVRLDVLAESILSAFVLVSILPSQEVRPPKQLVSVGGVYELQPPGLKFLRPTRLAFSYPAESSATSDGQSVPPAKLGIYAYDAQKARWFPLPSSVDSEKRVVAAEVEGTQPYVAFYGLFADLVPPEPPKMARLATETQRAGLMVTGTAEPASTVVLALNETPTETACGPDGKFRAELRLQTGENVLVAHCRDGAGNLSQPAPKTTIVLKRRHPTAVDNISFEPGQEAAWRREIQVKLNGKDSSSEPDTTLIWLKSAKSDSKSFEIEAVETGPTTGVYVARFKAAPRSDSAGQSAIPGEQAGMPAFPGEQAAVPGIATRVDGEEIVASWVPDPKIRASIPFRDRVGPRPPSITCKEVRQKRWDAFEDGQEAVSRVWQPLGTGLTVQSEDGNSFVRVRGAPAKVNNLCASAHGLDYSVVEFPFLSFDFRAAPATEVDMLLNLTQPNVGWRGIRLTDKQPYYARLGQFLGTHSDGQWHQAKVNLLPLLRRRYPGLADYRVKDIGLADWDGGERLFGVRTFGKSAERGGYYDLDNFSVGGLCPGNEATFQWCASDESGIAGFSFLLDKNPHTIPPEEATECVIWTGKRAEALPVVAPGSPEEAPEPETLFHSGKVCQGLADGVWWLHIRAKDGCGNWGYPNHFWLVVDTQAPKAEFEPVPEGGLPHGSGISVRLSDDGSGIDLSGMTVLLDGRELKGDARSVSYDLVAQRLMVRPDLVQPFPIWFLDGAAPEVRVRGIQDFAGHGMEGEVVGSFRPRSPVMLSQTTRVGKNGWSLSEPQIELRPEEKAAWELQWMRSLRGDKYAEKGCFIRELAVSKTTARDSGKPPAAVASSRGKTQPEFVVEVKVDMTTPGTKLRTTELPPAQGMEARTQITLEHSEFAYRRGGLFARYYRKPDYTDLVTERVDPSVYFFDDREQFTPVVPGAHSAVWEGALYVPERTTLELELALWYRAPASGKAWLDRELLFDLRPESLGVVGYQKRKVDLADGLHELRLEFSEPTDRAWSFALFVWRKGSQGEEIREAFGPKELYYTENVGTTWYRWNKAAFQVYSGPFLAPKGKNILQFYTEDRAGHAERVQSREFLVKHSQEVDIEVKE
jgi:hypothetical protein